MGLLQLHPHGRFGLKDSSVYSGNCSFGDSRYPENDVYGRDRLGCTAT